MPVPETLARKHRVSARSFKNAHARLADPRRRSDVRLWTGRMSAALAAAVILAAILMFTADESALRAVKSSTSPIIKAMARVTDIGKSDWYLIPSAILFLVTAFFDWSAYRLKAKAWLLRLFGRSAFFFGAVAGSGILVNILKIPVGRARPKLFDTFGAVHFEPMSVGYDFASMPSGHATTVGAVTMALMLWFPKWRWLALPLGFLAAATRVAAQAHYPSDVVAGFAFGALFALWFARWLSGRNVVFRVQIGLTLPKLR